MRKFSFLIVLIVLSASILVGCEGGLIVKQEDQMTKDTLVIGMEAGYPPFNWTQNDNSNGAVQIDGLQEYAGGYDVEIAKRIAEGLNRELIIKKIEWEGLGPALTSSTIDGIIAGMSPTDERKKSIDFSSNYYTSDLAIIVREGSPYEDAKSIQDFKGATLTGQLNTFHYDVIDQIEGVIKETAMEDFPSMRASLSSGIIDGYISEKPEGLSLAKADFDFVMVELEKGFQASEDETSIAVGLKKGSGLTKEVNKILEKISEEERLEIMNKAIINQPVNQ